MFRKSNKDRLRRVQHNLRVEAAVDVRLLRLLKDVDAGDDRVTPWEAGFLCTMMGKLANHERDKTEFRISDGQRDPALEIVCRYHPEWDDAEATELLAWLLDRAEEDARADR